MERDYEKLLPRVLAAMYPDRDVRDAVTASLSSYGSEPYHRERHRVRMGILKLAWSEPEKLATFIELACQDYRDLLCAAEYPLSSRTVGLGHKDPVKYRELRKREQAGYEGWLAQVLSD